MAWGISMTGMDELIRSLDRLPKEGARIASEALYEGAGVVADSVSRAVNSIRTQPFKYAKGGTMRLPSPEEKALVAGARHGVAKFKKNRRESTDKSRVSDKWIWRHNMESRKNIRRQQNQV